MENLVPVPDLVEARVNVTWNGHNGDLPQTVPFDATDDQVREFAREAVQGGIPGITADYAANFAGFVVDRYAATAEVPYARLMLRPKTAYGK